MQVDKLIKELSPIVLKNAINNARCLRRVSSTQKHSVVIYEIGKTWR